MDEPFRYPIEPERQDANNIASLKSLAIPWAIRATAELKLIERIIEGADSTSKLASECEVDEEACNRLLGFLIQLGIIEKTADIITVTSLGSALHPEHPLGLVNWLSSSGGGTFWDSEFANLADCIRTGRPAYEISNRPNPWEDLENDAQKAENVRQFMSKKTQMIANDISRLVGKYSPESVVDLGGSDTSLLSQIGENCPEAKLTLVDPNAFPDGSMSNIEVINKSLFDIHFEKCDVAILNNILHNWNDYEAVRWLARTASLADVVIVSEYVLDNDSLGVRELDLLMLVVFGGRERTVSEFEFLAGKTGLLLDSVIPTQAGPHLLTFARLSEDTK